jgi:hypothetical protein
MYRLFITAIVCLSLSRMASAGLVLPFTRITSDSAIDISSQLQLEVDQTNVGPSQVRFKISNLGPVTSNIAEIYWQDACALLSNLATLAVDTTSGVGFQYLDANPGSLPAGNTIGFVTAFAADEGKPGGPGAVDPGTGIMAGTMAAFQFDITAPNTYQMIEDALLSGDLRVGLHVRSINEGVIGGGTGDSFVSAVPEPSAFLLLGLVGSVTIVWRRLRGSR